MIKSSSFVLNTHEFYVSIKLTSKPKYVWNTGPPWSLFVYFLKIFGQNLNLVKRLPIDYHNLSNVYYTTLLLLAILYCFNRHSCVFFCETQKKNECMNVGRKSCINLYVLKLYFFSQSWPKCQILSLLGRFRAMTLVGLR